MSETPAIIHLPYLPPLSSHTDESEISDPKPSPRRKRSNVERFRTDDNEHAELIALARDSGLSFGAFMRASTIGRAGPRSKRAAPTEHSLLKLQHVIAINRAGGLVNQGIKALHEIVRKAPTANEPDQLADEIETTCKLLETAIPALNEALAAVRGA